MNRRRGALSGLALALLALPAGRALAVDATLDERAAAALAAMTSGERDDARWPFDDDERREIHYAPFSLDGVARADLGPEASGRVEELLAASLSRRGHETVRSIRELELAVREKERGRLLALVMGWARDPGRYLIAFFGDPAGASPWAFRYEGHHVSLHVTSLPGRAPATTPLFLGAEPRVVPEGWPGAGVAALGEEERLARALYAALPSGQRERATLRYESGRGLMLGQVRRVTPGEPLGVARAEMGPEAQRLLDALVERFVGLWNDAAAEARRAEIDWDALHFAHVEADDPSDAFYTRIQGPDTLIEIDNTEDGDHVHAVWHSPSRDFGEDLLAAHRRVAHGGAATSDGRDAE